MSSNKEEKQQYLYAEIIEGGFDPEEFQEFLQIRKPDGLDINKWDLKDLKDIVEEFKTSKKGASLGVNMKVIEQKKSQTKKFGQRVVNIPKKQSNIREKDDEPDTPIHKVTDIQQSPQKQRSKHAQQKKIPIKKQQQLRQQLQSSQESKQNPNIQTIEATQVVVQEEKFSSYTSSNEELFSKTIHCLRTEPNQILNKNVEVKIQKYQKMQGGFFEQGYVQYRVVTKSQMWAVMRRYNDFQWLRNQLDVKHPGYPIPPIARKGTFRSFDDDYLKKRMVILQNFINKILTIPQLKAEQIVEDFLKIDDPIQYLKSKKEKEVKDEKTKLEKLNTLKGKVNLVIDPAITKYMSQTNKYVSATQPKMEKVYKDWKDLSISFENSASILNGISNTFEGMNQDQSKFYGATQGEVRKEGASLYKLLQNMTKEWSSILEQQAKNISSLLYGVYKYEYINLISLNEAVKKVIMARNQYLQYKFKIQRLKEKLYDDRNFSRMDLPTNVFDKVTKNREAIPKTQLLSMMVPKDMQQEERLKQIYALCNFQCYQQVQRYFHQNPKSLSVIIQQLATKQSMNSSKNMMLWADTITEAMSLKEGRVTQQFEI